MNDPRRLREETSSDLERALLNAGVSYRASAGTRAKALAALGLAGTSAILVGNASAATLASVAKLTFAKVAAVVSLAGAVAVVPVGYYYVSHRQDAAASASASTRANRPVRAAVAAPVAPATQAEPPVATEAVSAAASVASRGGTRSAKPEARSSGANASLTRELAALDAARATLSGGQTAGALALLDTYSREFPHGRLEIEAEVLRIDALARDGRGAAAKRRAEAFVRRYPDSVFAARVRGYLEN